MQYPWVLPALIFDPNYLPRTAKEPYATLSLIDVASVNRPA